MQGNRILLIAAVVGAGVFLAWTRRAYFGEVRESIAGQRRDLPQCFVKQTAADLGPYYLFDQQELSEAVTPDEEEELRRGGWRSPIVCGVNDHPVAIAQDGLRSFNRFVFTGDARFLVRAQDAADFLLSLQKPDGSWRYAFDFNDLKAGWTSAMAQGQAASLLARVHQRLGDEGYLSAAMRAMEYALKPVADGGTLDCYPDGRPFLEEYPNSRFSPFTLNGSIFALWGLRDVALATGDVEMERTFDELASSIAAHLHAYDTGDWSLYSLRPDRTHLCDSDYHGVHVVQTRVMAELTGDPVWDRTSRCWDEYYYRRHARGPLVAWWRDSRRRLHELAGRFSANRGA